LLVLIRPSVSKPGQVPLDSFRALLQWLQQPKSRNRLDDQLRNELLAAHWFWDLRSVRDSLVLEGARPLVFPHLDRIGFQVHRGNFEGLVREGMMINENVVDFQLYSPSQVGQAVGLLLRLCQLLIGRLRTIELVEYVRSYHPGVEVLRRWAQPLVNEGSSKGVQTLAA
jgi:hypothetical protein